jgi:peptidoglycan/LPS O-acetylase OafA/YrhL
MAQSVALDQWRGVALLLVLVSHGFYFTDRVHGVGRVGVNLFFFISGLLVHRSLSRNDDAAAFWWRRFKRLYPALAVFLLVMLPVTWLFDDLSGYRRALPSALLFFTDYLDAPPRSLGHLWSIACEFQFYAVAPLVFLVGRRRPSVWLGVLAALLLVGALEPILDPTGAAKYHFEFAAWPLMLGFCCEHWKGRLAGLPGTVAVSRVALALLGASLVAMAFGLETRNLVIAGGSLALIPCFLSYLGGTEVDGASGRALTWLGRRTYSIYLWQQPLTICNYLPAVLHPLGAVASTLVGGLSYRWLERPFLSSRRRRKVLTDPLPSPQLAGVGS